MSGGPQRRPRTALCSPHNWFLSLTRLLKASCPWPTVYAVNDNKEKPFLFNSRPEISETVKKTYIHKQTKLYQISEGLSKRTWPACAAYLLLNLYNHYFNYESIVPLISQKKNYKHLLKIYFKKFMQLLKWSFLNSVKI